MSTIFSIIIIIPNGYLLRIRSIISKVLKYRLPSHIDFNNFREEIAVALNECCTRDGAEENMLSVML